MDVAPRGRRARGPARRPRTSRRRAPRWPAEGVGEVEHGRDVGSTETNDAAAPVTTPSVDRDRGGHAGQGVVAVPPGRLLEGRAACRPAKRPEPHAPTASSSSAQASISSGPCEEVGGRDLAAARGADGLDRRRPAATSTAGISPAASAWAIEPTVVPRLRIAGWATLRRAWRSSGRAAYAPVVPLEPRRAGPGRRPAPRPASTSTASEAGDPVDVDEVRRGGQAHVEQRDQALAAGEHLAVVADLGQDGDGLVDGARVRGARTGRASPDRSCLPCGGTRWSHRRAACVWQLLPSRDSAWARDRDRRPTGGWSGALRHRLRRSGPPGASW